MAWLVFAHGSSRTGILQTVAFFFLTIFARVAGRTLAAIALRQIGTAATVVAWLRSTFVDVDLAATSRETGRTETVGNSR